MKCDVTLGSRTLVGVVGENRDEIIKHVKHAWALSDRGVSKLVLVERNENDIYRTK